VAESQYDVRSELLQNLLSRVKEDPYPSATMMDMIEELLTPDDVPGYAEILMSKVSEDQFPSVSMLQRLKNLACV
jgi:hypothetical protein